MQGWSIKNHCFTTTRQSECRCTDWNFLINTEPVSDFSKSISKGGNVVLDAVLLMVITFLGYLFAYHLYGRFIGSRIFEISDTNPCPSIILEDGQDYVPTDKKIVFGFHFTAIAGTGPIVGPAIGIIWGWIPAMLWVFFGSVFIGALHDFGALIISLRNNGKSIFDYTSNYLSKRARSLFFVLIFFGLWVTLAVFGLIVAVIFSLYPESVIPVWFQIIIALFVWYSLNKKMYNFYATIIVGLIFMYLSMFVGLLNPIEISGIGNIPPTGVWTAMLLLYGFIASVVPVTVLLQSRGFMNACQLVVSMFLLVLGVIVAGVSGKMQIVAPPINLHPPGAPSIFPFLFIVIACGAVSGLHSLISSGVSSKQIKKESDSLLVGYGSMLLEGCLATLAIVAVSAGVGIAYKTSSGSILTGSEAWLTHYSSWDSLTGSGMASKLHAFTDGSANMIAVLGFSKKFAAIIIGVFVASFAGTTMDSVLRIQRYILSEFFLSINATFFANKYVSSAIAVFTAMGLAFGTGASGEGALTLWPLLGSVNQMIACSALIVITVYLKKNGGIKWIISGIPALFMGIITVWASIKNHFVFSNSKMILLQMVNIVCIFVILVLLFEGLLAILNKET